MVFEKGLVDKGDGLKARSIIDNHDSYSGLQIRSRRLTGSVLAYVTPWNSRGYSNAETFGAKVTHVAPVWYQIREESGKFVLTGGHDVDKTWIEKVRRNSTVEVAAATCSSEGQCVEEDDGDIGDQAGMQSREVSKPPAKIVPRGDFLTI